MFQAGDEDPWAEFNLRYCKVVLCLTSSQSIGIPRFVEDSQTDNLFNLGLSVSQEIPLCVSMDYDEAGEAHFLPRSNSMVLFPGLPVLREKVAAGVWLLDCTVNQFIAPASLLCTSSELSSDLEGKNEREEKETTSLLKRKNVCLSKLHAHMCRKTQLTTVLFKPRKQRFPLHHQLFLQ